MFNPKSDLKVFSTTRRVIAEVRLENAQSFNLRSTYHGVQYALKTCRIDGTTYQNIRFMSGYQFAKMVCTIANRRLLDSEIPRFLMDHYN